MNMAFRVPYEVVFNNDPSRAYLMETNPLPVQILVMAHVYSHNDFMKNNRRFQITRGGVDLGRRRRTLSTLRGGLRPGGIEGGRAIELEHRP